MDLLLWRHAEAEDGIPDLKRKLTARGEKQAQKMAAWLKQHAPENLRILVSPAKRCQQTAQALGLPFETDPRLGPDSDVSALLAAINWPDGGERDPEKSGRLAVLVVGHQPTLGQTAALLLSGEEAYWTIKKGAVWWFTNRTRQGETQTVLRAVVPAEFL
ncbi:SixA phosphatase family protein [Propionivibrio limicola]|uniref:SixA phosphatase family protein n=1 Tax=Propionivibrio limicola TaxID=167645 RepID=UPI0012912A13|nr:histidine phosphatase family protein [Propionivibrio limicola]